MEEYATGSEIDRAISMVKQTLLRDQVSWGYQKILVLVRSRMRMNPFHTAVPVNFVIANNLALLAVGGSPKQGVSEASLVMRLRLHPAQSAAWHPTANMAALNQYLLTPDRTLCSAAIVAESDTSRTQSFISKESDIRTGPLVVATFRLKGRHRSDAGPFAKRYQANKNTLFQVQIAQGQRSPHQATLRYDNSKPFTRNSTEARTILDYDAIVNMSFNKVTTETVAYHIEIVGLRRLKIHSEFSGKHFRAPASRSAQPR